VASVIDVLTLDGAKIAAVTGFLASEVSTELPSPPPAQGQGTDEALTAPVSGSWLAGAELFSRFGLPVELP
jgi:hypothetical protein